ncbi:hypothetical protein HanRHA438_Chr07g0303601 [Helianthus annuus]|nr:hypothetical protein HanRHA438_Chr07g0303601 [Helianthus annuus]
MKSTCATKVLYCATNHKLYDPKPLVRSDKLVRSFTLCDYIFIFFVDILLISIIDNNHHGCVQHL